MLTSRKDGGVLARNWNMNKRIGDLLRSSNKNKRICKGRGETSEISISGNQFVWSELSEEVASIFSRSVVSLALSNEHAVLFACSGIALESVECFTKFLTTASLARALIDNKRKDHDNLKVEVCRDGNVFTGFLGEYDLDHNIAVVNVMSFPDVHVVRFNNPVELLPPSKVVALGHGISGNLMATSGELTGVSSGSEYSDELKLSSCKISKVWEGGPLFDFDGNFLGMNCFSVIEGTFFLPRWMVLGRLARFTTLREIKFPVWPNFFKAVRVGQRRTGDVPNSNQEGDLDTLGYPKPSVSMLNAGMILVNTFEEPFGDEYGQGVWSELSEPVSSRIHENIVALASFNGEKRFFACTGFFIEWNGFVTVLTSASLVRICGYENKIVENLRIEVLLPNQQRGEGTLLHYNLHYNVALVSVKYFHASHPAKIQHLWDDHSCDVVAVGYCFESGKLMAARGEQFGRPVTLDCKFLEYSTCKISKAGIGGPLLDFDGRFIGMNFYENKVGTPFLLWREILSVLEHFKTEGYADEVGQAMVKVHNVHPNRWPVPMPFWCHPEDRASKVGSTSGSNSEVVTSEGRLNCCSSVDFAVDTEEVRVAVVPLTVGRPPSCNGRRPWRPVSAAASGRSLTGLAPAPSARSASSAIAYHIFRRGPRPLSLRRGALQ